MKKTLILILTAILVFTSVFCVSCTEEKEIDIDGSEVSRKEDSANKLPAKIKIGSYNIGHTRYVKYDIKKIADEIKALDLDVVGIQEVDRYAERSQYKDMVAELVRYTGMPFCEYFEALTLDGDEAKYGQKGQYGLVILSKYPIKKPEVIKLDCPSIEQRIVAHATLAIKGKDVEFYNTHLSFENNAVRKNQFETLKNLVEGKKSCIITGDFNIATAKEFEAIPLKRINASEKTFITYPEDNLPLDNIFYTEDFKFIKSDMSVTGNSDHNLIYAEFELQP